MEYVKKTDCGIEIVSCSRQEAEQAAAVAQERHEAARADYEKALAGINENSSKDEKQDLLSLEAKMQVCARILKMASEKAEEERRRESNITSAGYLPLTAAEAPIDVEDSMTAVDSFEVRDGKMMQSWKTIVSEQKCRKKIDELKAVLSASDYKIIKCYEASLVGEALPYDVEVLHSEREKLRDQINLIESKIIKS